jgi:hypothetical protein
MRRAIIILSLLIILLVPFLSACDTGDLQQLIYWAKLWAMVHDITDENGNPNFGAITRFAVGEAFGVGSTGDKEGDAAIDAGRVLNNIRQAEDEADKGWEALYKGQNIKADVLPHYDQAVRMRPDDWSYRNERGIAQLENLENPENAKAAKADFDEATALAKKSGKPAEYLRMLKNREQAMARLVTHQKEIHAYPTKDVYIEQSRTYDELYKLTNDKTYLLLKQQADTNLQEGYYWTRDTTE